MRAWSPILLLALVAPFAAAQDPAAPTRPRALIERSRIDFPAHAGPLTMIRSEVLDPVTSGLSIAYALAGHPNATISVFVYPAGRQDPKAATDGAMAEIEQALEYMAAQGEYTKLALGPVEPFAVTLPADEDAPEDLSVEAPAPADPTVAPVRPEAKDAGPEALMLQLLAESGLHARELAGARRQVAFTYEGVARQSLAYSFFRHLYLVKVRASDAADGDDSAAFAAAVDAAVRAVVPAIEVTNEGGCGDVVVDAEGDGAEDLMRGIVRVQAENCVGKLDDGGPGEGFRREVLVIPAEAWAGQ
jgi:hypothetical protein